MSLTVARYRRTWTPELVEKLNKDVTRLRNKGFTVRMAMEALAPQWGITADSLLVRYYTKFHHKTANKSYAPPTSLRKLNKKEVVTFINLIQKMGYKVRVSV